MIKQPKTDTRGQASRRNERTGSFGAARLALPSKKVQHQPNMLGRLIDPVLRRRDAGNLALE